MSDEEELEPDEEVTLIEETYGDKDDDDAYDESDEESDD
jgi:hypothetical protein